MTVHLCEGCANVLTTPHQDGSRLCAWCWTEQEINSYDEQDAADERQQQELDEADV